MDSTGESSCAPAPFLLASLWSCLCLACSSTAWCLHSCQHTSGSPCELSTCMLLHCALPAPVDPQEPCPSLTLISLDVAAATCCLVIHERCCSMYAPCVLLHPLSHLSASASVILSGCCCSNCASCAPLQQLQLSKSNSVILISFCVTVRLCDGSFLYGAAGGQLQVHWHALHETSLLPAVLVTQWWCQRANSLPSCSTSQPSASLVLKALRPCIPACCCRRALTGAVARSARGLGAARGHSAAAPVQRNPHQFAPHHERATWGHAAHGGRR